MHISWSSTSLTLLALLPNYGWALPSDGIGLSRRTLEFPKNVADLPTTVGCNNDEQNLIKTALKDAMDLAAHAREMEMWHPAYRTFFDHKAPISAAKVAEASDQQKAHYAFVKNVFVQAHKYLSDPAHNVQVVCGVDKPKGTPNSCRETLYAFASSLATPTVVICPKFFALARTERGRAKTEVPMEKGGQIDICKTPDQLDHVYNAGMILLHEMMHLQVVSPKFTNVVKTNIVDCVYGAYLCGYIARYSTSIAMANADSYANAALSQYMNIKCGDKNFATTFHQAKIEVPLRSKPALQPMGEDDNWDRCIGLPEEAYTGLPDSHLKQPGPSNKLPELEEDEGW